MADVGLKKHINLFTYALDSIFRFKTRTIAIVLSLIVALAILGSVAFISDGLEREAVLSTFFAPDVTVQLLQAGRQIPVPVEFAKNITGIQGVDRVVQRVWGYIYQNNKIYTVMGIDAANMPVPEGIGFTMIKGRFLQPNDTDSVIVGSYFANVFGLSVNDTMTLFNESREHFNYTVIGIFSMDVNLYTSDLILMPIQDARNLFAISTSLATDLCVYSERNTQTETVAARIVEMIPNLRVLTRAALGNALATAYGARSGFISTIWYILLLAVAMVAWNQASAVSSESKREVGILKSLGFSTLDVLEIRIAESIILGIVSASISVFFAIAYDLYLGAPIIKDFMLGWASVYPTFPLPTYVQLTSVSVLYAVALFPLLVGSLIPAWKSAITEPDIAMRGA
jgi:ABC-type lipoprotein release transport system permease subunit